MKFDWKFVVIALFIALIGAPILFNFLFIWESGWSKGDTSDWFTLYGNIFGGLIGGFFTYLALLLTFKEQRNTRIETLKPRIDIPHQRIEFVEDGNGASLSNPIQIEFNNIGGSVAKNIQCRLSISNLDEVIANLDFRKYKFSAEKKEYRISKVGNVTFPEVISNTIYIKNEKNEVIDTIGSIYSIYNWEFIGSCVPIIINHQAKVNYEIPQNVSALLDIIARMKKNRIGYPEKGDFFVLKLEVQYSSIEYGETTDYFKIELHADGIELSDAKIKHIYILKASEIDSENKYKNR